MVLYREPLVLQLWEYFSYKRKLLFFSFLLLCAAVQEIKMFEVVNNEKGYHKEVGIPVAKQIYMAETTVSPSESKVMNPASLAAHPFLAGVVINVKGSYSVCGSSILSNTRAITAAHCWWDGWTSADRFTMVFGSEYIFVGGIRVETSNVQTHPYWDPSRIFNDLAMITFSHLDFTDYVQPIALPFILKNSSLIGYWAQASGYGRIEPGSIGYYPNQVETDVVLKIIESEKCVNLKIIMEKTLCATNVGTTSHCISHSGGPLVTEYNSQRYLIGVATSGDHNCQAKLSEFVRVTSYLPWIQSMMSHRF